jgi:hypothetical protein
MNTFIAIAYPDSGDLINSQAQGNLLIPDGLIATGGTVNLDYLASPSLADPILFF